MGGSLSEGLRTVFAVVLSCLVIGFVFMQWSSVKESGNTALTDSNSTITQMDEAKYTQYDAAVVTGSEVVNVIKLHQNDQIYVGVNTGSGMVNYIYSGPSLTGAGADLADARDKTNAAYINPNSKFTGKVIRAVNTDAIVGIEFTKS
ncbi:hypothetical protein bpr_IV036 (plasmid) [Butyrivibrio proteoclasticus B316]|uniref:Uncharacterized protein n=1 Tax=Butyrivibrio proteoclasticus (strain ATCC 51982 / DSM 14932 / B316) TaxID=515622 RepID=E0S4R9_BUTPB|nr:hypothetical protein [Butyrivibrio proteoclasticus]ADL36401.1 hypothetical protein bpr_IV036 [Butyrivibrio proteoclasticus B316]